MDLSPSVFNNLQDLQIIFKDYAEFKEDDVLDCLLYIANNLNSIEES